MAENARGRPIKRHRKKERQREGGRRTDKDRKQSQKETENGDARKPSLYLKLFARHWIWKPLKGSNSDTFFSFFLCLRSIEIGCFSLRKKFDAEDCCYVARRSRYFGSHRRRILSLLQGEITE